MGPCLCNTCRTCKTSSNEGELHELHKGKRQIFILSLGSKAGWRLGWGQLSTLKDEQFRLWTRMATEGVSLCARMKSWGQVVPLAAYGRGNGVGLPLGVGCGLALGVGLGVVVGDPVDVGVEVGVAVAVGVAVGVELGVVVGVDVGVAVAVADGVEVGVAVALGEGVGVGCAPPTFRSSTIALCSPLGGNPIAAAISIRPSPSKSAIVPSCGVLPIPKR